MTEIKIGIYTAYSKHYDKVMYVGQSDNIHHRWENGHQKLLKENRHYNQLFQDHYNKFGDGDLEWSIVEECSIEELDARELYWEKFYGTYNTEKQEGKGFNMTWGASPPVMRGEDNPMKRREIREKLTGENNPAKRSEVREKISIGISASWTDKRKVAQSVAMFVFWTDKRRGAQSAAMSGEKNPMFGRSGESNPAKRTEVREKLRIINLGENNPNSKLTNDQREMIVQLREQDAEYWTQERLGKEFGVARSNISTILKNWKTRTLNF